MLKASAVERRAFYEALKRRADIRGMNMRAARVEGKPLTTVLPVGLGARAQAGDLDLLFLVRVWDWTT